MLAVRAFSASKFMWGLVFLGVVGAFTPFRSGQFSHVYVSLLDLATLALFAISPIVFRKSRTPVVTSVPKGMLP